MSKPSKRYRVGGVFTKDGRIDFFRALELSFNMAIEFYATLVTHSRAALAAEAKGGGTARPHVPEEWPAVLLKRRMNRLPSIQELADAFSAGELTEIQENLLAGLVRHIDAFNRGYGDALRSNRLQAQVRELFRDPEGKFVYHPDRPRFIQDGWTRVSNPDAVVPASGNMLARIVSKRLALGNESSARRMLKPYNEKKRFYLDEIEPRMCRRKTG